MTILLSRYPVAHWTKCLHTKKKFAGLSPVRINLYVKIHDIIFVAPNPKGSIMIHILPREYIYPY